ncbi:Rieske (2Fe-2S) protein [Paenibacillus hodogayensis]|uniref:Rieske (2Fe-2S) protein n=1 Tax=Paenibacillus hodogayensis TaxID=279208 RepID=A0ABV5W1H6_9BACL
MALYPVSAVEELPEGTFKIVQIGKRSVGVYNVKGDYYAVLNYCPHQGAELCRGTVCGTTLESQVYEFIYGRDQEILRCPWHGWEFDLKSGKSLFSDKVRTRSYPVVVENGTVQLVIGAEETKEEHHV